MSAYTCDELQALYDRYCKSAGHAGKIILEGGPASRIAETIEQCLRARRALSDAMMSSAPRLFRGLAMLEASEAAPNASRPPIDEKRWHTPQ